MNLENAPSWQKELTPEFEQPYMQALAVFLHAEANEKKVIYPPSSNWLHALEVTPLNDVKNYITVNYEFDYGAEQTLATITPTENVSQEDST